MLRFEEDPTMTTQIILWCVLLPIVAILIAMIVNYFCQSTDQTRAASILVSTTTVISWSVGAALAQGGRQSWELWPEDFWRRALWPTAATSVALAILYPFDKRWSDIRWPIAAAGIAAIIYLLTPTGEGWEDVVELHLSWTLAASLSCFLNLWSMHQMANRDAKRWISWVAVACIAAPLIYAAGVYGGLAENIFACLVATFAIAIFATFARFEAASAVIYPAALMIGTSTASARYYSYEQPNPAIMGIILFLPSIVALVDRFIPKRFGLSRIIVAALVAIFFLGLLAYYLNPEAETEEW